MEDQEDETEPELGRLVTGEARTETMDLVQYLLVL